MTCAGGCLYFLTRLSCQKETSQRELARTALAGTLGGEAGGAEIGSRGREGGQVHSI